MSKDLTGSKLIDLIPESIAQDEQVKHSADAIDRQLKGITSSIDLPSIYVSIDRLTSEQLDHVAYGWDAPVWRDSWPVVLKRSVLKNVVREKRKKGTLKAVKDALASIQSAATIEEWWQTEPKGTPHTFTVFATLADIEGTLDAEMQEDLYALIDDAKPVRSHYSFVVIRELNGKVGVSGYVRNTTYARIRYENVENITVTGTVAVFPAARANVSRTIIAVAR